MIKAKLLIIMNNCNCLIDSTLNPFFFFRIWKVLYQFNNIFKDVIKGFLFSLILSQWFKKLNINGESCVAYIIIL